MGGRVEVGDGGEVAVGGGRVAVGAGVREGDGKVLGVPEGGRVGVGVVSGPAVLVGIRATGSSVGDPQAVRLPLIQSSARRSSTVGRRT